MHRKLKLSSNVLWSLSLLPSIRSDAILTPFLVGGASMKPYAVHS